jgi:hypothetical protein
MRFGSSAAAAAADTTSAAAEAQDGFAVNGSQSVKAKNTSSARGLADRVVPRP